MFNQLSKKIVGGIKKYEEHGYFDICLLKVLEFYKLVQKAWIYLNLCGKIKVQFKSLYHPF